VAGRTLQLHFYTKTEIQPFTRGPDIFQFCADPSTLETTKWLACYLTTGKHMGFYVSFGTVLLLLAITAPLAMTFGMGGAMAARSRVLPLSWLGKGYIAIVRGVPDIAFFLFFVIALDQGIELLRHQIKCPDWPDAVRQGNDFIVCAQAKMPLGNSPQWMHETYGFFIAVFTFAIVFGAFAANVLFGAMLAVPRPQVETAESYGMTRRQTFWRIIVPQMWVYALPGLGNLWMVLIKATPLLFLLGVEDIVYWARELGATKTPQFTAYPHGDWRMWYFLALLVFYLAFTKFSEIILERTMRRLTRGQATSGGEAQRKATG
jgi:polar amino acid transport system permease protein